MDLFRPFSMLQKSTSPTSESWCGKIQESKTIKRIWANVLSDVFPYQLVNSSKKWMEYLKLTEKKRLHVGKNKHKKVQLCSFIYLLLFFKGFVFLFLSFIVFLFQKESIYFIALFAWFTNKVPMPSNIYWKVGFSK